MEIYRFRDCLLNTAERIVLKGTTRLDLKTKTFDVLIFLIENDGRLVTKDEILGTVWNGSLVEEGNLPVHIFKLRRALGESKDERYIETVQGTGYRLVVPVETVGPQVWQKRLSKTPQTDASELPSTLAFDSVAVLPIENESSDPNLDYVVDGLTEGFINNLSLIPDLRVIARNSVYRYKNSSVDPREVGEALGVAAVLTGRIRSANGEVTLGAELVRVVDGSQVWGSRFQRPFDEILKIEQEVCSSVSAKLRSNGSGRRRRGGGKSATENSESYKAYLKGKYFLSKRTRESVKRAIEYFSESILHDPGNVRPYVKAVDCYRFLYVLDALPRKTVIEKIKPFVSGLADLEQEVDIVQLMHGEINFHLVWNFREAERYVREALRLNPNSIDACYRLCEVLAMQSRLDESRESIHRLLELDPFSRLTYKRVARLYYLHGSCHEAIELLDEALELEPNDWEALALKGSACVELGELHEALALFEESYDSHANVEILSMIGYVEALAGFRPRAEEIIERMRKEWKSSNWHALKIARIYLGLGDIEVMYEYLEQAVEQRELDLFALLYDPRWKPVRSDQRFIDICHRVGLVI